MAELRTSTVAVIGSGAIGSVFGTVLHESEHHVVLCVRRATASGHRRVDRRGDVREVTLPVLDDPAEVTGPVDWVLLATKAYDVPGAADWLRALVGPGTTVVVLQNGVDHGARLRPWLPSSARILPALMYLAVEVAAPGHIDWSFGDLVTVPAGPDADRFAALAAGTPLRVVPTTDFAAAAWRKLLLNVALNPTTTLTDQRLTVLGDPSVRSLVRTMLTEVLATAWAVGVSLPSSPVQDTIDFADGLPPGDGSSMFYDRLAGRPTEHELIVGAVVRAADEHGVAVPVCRTVLALLRGLNFAPS